MRLSRDEPRRGGQRRHSHPGRDAAPEHVATPLSTAALRARPRERRGTSLGGSPRRPRRVARRTTCGRGAVTRRRVLGGARSPFVVTSAADARCARADHAATTAGRRAGSRAGRHVARRVIIARSPRVARCGRAVSAPHRGDAAIASPLCRASRRRPRVEHRSRRRGSTPGLRRPRRAATSVRAAVRPSSLASAREGCAAGEGARRPCRTRVAAPPRTSRQPPRRQRLHAKKPAQLPPSRDERGGG